MFAGNQKANLSLIYLQRYLEIPFDAIFDKLIKYTGQGVDYWNKETYLQWMK